MAHDAAALDAAIAAGRTAILHAIEGGFALGATPAEIDANVADLAHRGVVYVTLAHLFWRGVATNAPALPFMPDWLYRLVFPSPKVGLTELGTAAARALVRERVLVDITHMSEQAIADTFAAVGPEAPVIASHMACRFGKLSYNLTDDVIREVGRRGGVMGVIACTHYTHDGLRPTSKVKTFEDSMELVFAHIDRIAQVTGSHDHAAIGTDLDGWIKPALPASSTSAACATCRTRSRRSTVPRWPRRSPAATCSRCCGGPGGSRWGARCSSAGCRTSPRCSSPRGC